MYPHFDNATFVVYMIWGLLFMLGVCKIQTCKANNGYQISSTANHWLWTFALFFATAATFRYINNSGIGGMDAPAYKYYYETAFLKNTTSYHEHLDLGYQLIYKAFRYFTFDYHFCFFFQHFIVVLSMFLFIREFRMEETNYAPYVLMAHSFTLGFASMRSSFGIAIIFLSFVLLHRERTKLALLLAATSLLMHKACAIYFMAIPFYLYFKNRTFKLKHAILLLIISLSVGNTLRLLFVQFASDIDLGGVYDAYARNSVEKSFFEVAFRTAIEQILLGVLLVCMNGKFQKFMSTASPENQITLKMLWIICVYDILLIPINYMIGNWRSHEFLYIPRIVMWGELLWLLFRPFGKNVKLLLTVLCIALYMLRMQMSFVGHAVSGGLMPYYFEPFMNVF